MASKGGSLLDYGGGVAGEESELGTEREAVQGVLRKKEKEKKKASLIVGSSAVILLLAAAAAAGVFAYSSASSSSSSSSSPYSSSSYPDTYILLAQRGLSIQPVLNLISAASQRLAKRLSILRDGEQAAPSYSSSPATHSPGDDDVEPSDWSYTPKSKEPTEFDMQVREDSPWNESAQLALRTAFHFQPRLHWMNAPLYYKGWYHLFYQYNPSEAYWGLISWGHAVSRDLIHWLYLEIAMEPDHWYDYNGVWTGSATILEDGTPGVIYTGSTRESVQLQNVAFPSDASDPLLRNWTKVSQNPVLAPPAGINYTDFRDPTTGWRGADGLWTITIGSQINDSGVALLYRSPDFVTWSPLGLDHLLHRVNATGMWECVDFYPILASGHPAGLDTSSYGPGVKHVIKASMDDSRIDYYTIGSYDPSTFTFTPDDPSLDLTYGFRYDYGRFYASKTFFDPVQQRRILFGWINESDTRQDDVIKGWAGLQTIPRQVWFDNGTQVNLKQWPVEEITSLRIDNITFQDITLQSESVLQVEGATGSQWDINLVFANPLQELDMDSSSNATLHNSALGPFGIYVLSSEDLQERTGVYFYLSPTEDNGGTKILNSWTIIMCNDLSSSSLASNVDNGVHGGQVIVLDEENELSLRILVDHSIIESFAQGGRTVASSRVYPTMALNNASHLFLFNNGTTNILLKEFEAWRLTNIDLRDY